jgi:hypothetical protein
MTTDLPSRSLSRRNSRRLDASSQTDGAAGGSPVMLHDLSRLIAQLATMLTAYSRSRALACLPDPSSWSSSPSSAVSRSLSLAFPSSGLRKQWMYDLDPFTRIISGIISTELHQLPVRYVESELKVCPDRFSSISFGELERELIDVLSPLSPLSPLFKVFKVFSPPAGQTCTERASQYIAAAGGHLSDASAQSAANSGSFLSSFLDSRRLRD